MVKKLVPLLLPVLLAAGALAAPTLPDYTSICQQSRQSDDVRCQCSPEINQVAFNNQTIVQILQKSPRLERLFILDCAEADIDLGHFARVQVENVTQVRVHSLQVGRDTNLVIKTAGSLTLEGQVDLLCTEKEGCSGNNKTWQGSEYQVGKGNNLPRPHLVAAQQPDVVHGGGPPILQVRALNVANLTLNKLATTDQVDFRLEVTSAKSVVIKNSYFNHLQPSAIQVSQTPEVTVQQSEFHNATIGCLVLDGGNITVKDSLMSKQALLLRSPERSAVQFRCTASPDHFEFDLQAILESADPDCASAVSQWSAAFESETECTEAITLAVISAAILMLVIAVLLYMDRTGRLENYL